MATVELPSPGLFAAILHALRSADLRRETVSAALADVIHSLSDKEAQQLPTAISGVLPLLRSDLDRLRFAAEVLVRFDMFEAAEMLIRIAIDINDHEMLHSAAALSGNPGVSSSLRKQLSKQLRDDRRIQILLDDSLNPSNSEERLLYEQRWPGTRAVGGNHRLAPVAVLDKSLPAKKVLDLAIKLVDAGAVVRQLGIGNPLPNWFGPQTIVICRLPTRSRVLSKHPRFAERQIIVDPQLDNDRDYTLLLRQFDSALMGRGRLRLSAYDDPPSQLWDPDVYTLGVYETGEAAFLTSASKSSFYNLAKQGHLQPRNAGTTVWAFNDLVAVRTWQYLKTQSTRRVKMNIVPALAKFAGDPKAVRIGATSSGRVLVDQGDGWVDIQTGEQTLDINITNVDDVFRPFNLGGRHAPDMLHASENTRLHPAVLHGVPHLKDFRIPARALAKLHERGGEDAVIAAYPKLKGTPIADTIAVGHKLAEA